MDISWFWKILFMYLPWQGIWFLFMLWIVAATLSILVIKELIYIISLPLFITVLCEMACTCWMLILFLLTNDIRTLIMLSGIKVVERLGHISRERMERLVKENILRNLDFSNFEVCVDYMKRKLIARVRKKAIARSERIL